MFRSFGAESIVENCYHEDNNGANGTGDALVILASDETQDGRVESRHEVVRKQGRIGRGFLFILRTEDWVNLYPLYYLCDAVFTPERLSPEVRMFDHLVTMIFRRSHRLRTGPVYM
jgi:hypothetical protein